MALVSAWNASGNSIHAIYAPGGKTGQLYSNGGTNAISADATAISGYSLAMTNAVTTKIAVWTARRNSSANRGQAFACRFSPTYTGAPAARKGIFSLSGSAGRGPQIDLQHETSGPINLTIKNEGLLFVVNAVNMGAWSPTSGTWYDICVNLDGTTTANACKVTIDGTVLGSATLTTAFTSSWSNEFFGEIMLGATDLAAGAATQKYEEWAWYDTNVDFTANVALASGNGLLNGASRTSLISDVAGATLTVRDGYNTTDPGVSKVLTSAGTYIINGVTKTPTYNDTNLIDSNVKNTVAYGVSSTGSFVGSGGGGGYLRRR
jgi:hypothetical protein